MDRHLLRSFPRLVPVRFEEGSPDACPPETGARSFEGRGPFEERTTLEERIVLEDRTSEDWVDPSPELDEDWDPIEPRA